MARFYRNIYENFIKVVIIATQRIEDRDQTYDSMQISKVPLERVAPINWSEFR